KIRIIIACRVPPFCWNTTIRAIEAPTSTASGATLQKTSGKLSNSFLMTKRAPLWQYILIHALAIAPLALTAYEYLTNTLPVVLDRHLVIRFGAVGLAFL